MSLTDATVKNAKIQDKPYKLFDSGGLFVLVHSNGSKYWRFKYRFEGRAIEHYSGNFITKCALKLSSMVMMRPGAFIRAEWKGIDLENALWTVEVKDMKAPMLIKNANRDIDAHLIPLPKQAVEIFKALYPFTGASQFVFQSPATRGGKDAPMSNETVTKALQRMGFQGQMTGHGFRSMASTLLNEMRRPDGGRMWDKDAIERQLSHKDKDAIRAAYNRADYLEERRLMLQCWADYLDMLKDGGRILQFPVKSIIS